MKSISSNLLACLCCLGLTTAFPTQEKRDISNGPVIPLNFPDPAFIQADDGYYAYATSSGRRNVPVAYSADFKDWSITGKDALPYLPSWGTNSVWGPDVIRRADGVFVMYFTAFAVANTGSHCIGAATSTSPSGPFIPADQPITCRFDEGGVIDVSGFQDWDGTYYAVYKVDTNNLGGGGACGNGDLQRDTPLELQRLDWDAMTPVGEPIKILSRDDSDGPLVEAPSLVRSVDGTYVLFYSSHCYNSPDYNTKYAIAPTIRGPYSKVPQALLSSGSRLYSPGGADVSPDGTRLLFHADESPGDPSIRQVWSADIFIQRGIVYLSGSQSVQTY